jgi:hypothetical protein
MLNLVLGGFHILYYILKKTQNLMVEKTYWYEEFLILLIMSVISSGGL